MRHLCVAVGLGTVLTGVVAGHVRAWGEPAEGPAQRKATLVEGADRSARDRHVPILECTCRDSRTKLRHDPFAARGMPSTLVIPFPNCGPNSVEDMPHRPSPEAAPRRPLKDRVRGPVLYPARTEWAGAIAAFHQSHEQWRLPCTRF
jgi:hypothetical protein